MTLTLPTVFASVDDVEARFGRDLTIPEATQAEFMCGMATISIMIALGVTPSFEPADDAVPMLGMLTVEVVYRVMSNPNGLVQRSETIGSYSYSEMLGPRNQQVPGLALTPAEELMIRNVVFGANTGSVKLYSQADEYAENIWWPYLLWYGGQLSGDSEGDPMAVWK